MVYFNEKETKKNFYEKSKHNLSSHFIYFFIFKQNITTNNSKNLEKKINKF